MPMLSMAQMLGCLLVARLALAAPLTFTHMGSTWTLEVEGTDLHVTAECPEDVWCGFGFNEAKPKMDGADVFTFGYHNGVDLHDCPTAGCGSSSCGCGCGATTTKACGCGCGCGATTTGCGCGATTTGCGCAATSTTAAARRLESQNPYIPRVRNLKVHLPTPSAPGKAQTLQTVGGIVGIALNSVLFVHEHPEEGMTWLFDDCGGHGDTYGHYHYHAPPLCLMKSLGLPVPEGSWWKTSGEKAWPTSGPEVQIGWALDGVPIMGPYKDGKRTEKKILDECHGATDASGVYRYYLVAQAPYMPPCLRGALGNVSSFRSSKEGTPCEDAEFQQMTTEVQNGFKVLLGNGCPDHRMFKNVETGRPYGMKSKTNIFRKFRKLGSNYGTCPAGGGCGGSCGCGCGCGCGSTTAAGCGCGCGSTTAASCGCGSTTACGCGCGSTTAAGCGCGSTTAAGCGCGCGAYACPGQMFCAMGMTKKTSTGKPVSLSQCNLDGHSITIDAQQDLTQYSLTFENGKMKASAHRKLSTGDSTDLVLTTDKTYYILMTVGKERVSGGSTIPAIQVGYHGPSSTQTLVCVSTLLAKGECKEPAAWTNDMPRLVVSANAFRGGNAWPLLFSLGSLSLWATF